MANKRRAQAPKPRNEGFKRAMMDKQRSSAADPFRNRAKYGRSDRRDNSWRNYE